MSNNIPNICLEIINRIRLVVQDKESRKKFVVLHAKKKSTGESVFLLGLADKLNEGGACDSGTEMAMIAEFLPDKSIEELYDLQNWWFAEEMKPTEPLPNNVIPFRRKK